jgi:hypothetical protein
MAKEATRDPLPTNRGGRPRKFAEPSRPVTVTLPDRTLELLQAVDEDRAKAITKVADGAVYGDGSGRAVLRLVEIQPGIGVIIVGPSKRLRDIPWLRLAEIAPARYLLAIPTGTPPERLELALIDLLDNLDESEDYERTLLNGLRKHIGNLRREDRMFQSEIILVRMQPADNALSE